ncbi:MAG: efflux RND transporter permease subunit [Gammaproteobacteria bacterium]
MKRYLEALWTNRASLTLLVIALLAAGWLAEKSLPESTFPDVDFPRVAVVVSAGNLPVRYMLLAVTHPLETLAKSVAGVRTVRSQTGIGLSKLHIYFDPDVNPQLAYLMVQARLAHIKLPPGAKVAVNLMTPHIKPFAQYALVSNTVGSAEMRPFFSFQVRPSLLSVHGVYQVKGVGRGWPEVLIHLDRRKLAEHNLGSGEVVRALDSYQGPFYSGLINAYHQRFLLVTRPRPTEVANLKNLQINLPGASGTASHPLPLSALGSMKIGPPPRILGAAVSGWRHALLIDISAQANTNVPSVASKVQQQIRSLEEHLPTGVHLIKVYDFSDLIHSSLNDVWVALALGAALAWLVVWLFIGRLNAALATLVVVPISLAITFLLLKILGFGLNIMTLGGITAAIGALVDHAIVVMEQGLRSARSPNGASPPHMLSLAASGRILSPMTFATLTSCIVFLPLVFLSGTLGLLFRHMALAIVISLVVSQLVALSVTPILSALIAGQHPKQRSDQRWARRLRVMYSKFLRQGLRRPWLAVAIGVLLAAIGLASGLTMRTAFLPAWDQGAIAVPFKMPVGTPVTKTLKVARRLAAIAGHDPAVARVSAVVGRSLENPRATSNKGDLVVILRAHRQTNAEEVIERLRHALRNAQPNLIELKLHQIQSNRLGNLSGANAPLEVMLFGQHDSVLRKAGASLAKKIHRDGNFVGVTFKSPSAGPELQVLPKSGQLEGLTPKRIAQQILAGNRGREAGFLLRGEQILPIRVRVDSPPSGPRTVKDYPVRLANGQWVPLKKLAHIKLVGAVPYVTHDNLVPYAYIQATPRHGIGLSKGADRLKRLIRHINLPQGVSVVVGGYYREQSQGFRQMTAILAGALLILLVLLGFQFGGQRGAIAALVSVALAGSGSFLALRIFGIALDSSAFLGVLLVFAIAVNNVILIFTLARQRASGTPDSSHVERAARHRLRPIVMTMLADVLGFLPLAIGIGRGTALLQPLAIAAMGGLVVALASSLWMAPVLYAGLSRNLTLHSS